MNRFSMRLHQLLPGSKRFDDSPHRAPVLDAEVGATWPHLCKLSAQFLAGGLRELPSEWYRDITQSNLELDVIRLFVVIQKACDCSFQILSCQLSTRVPRIYHGPKG